MKTTALILTLATTASLALAQTAPKPATAAKSTTAAPHATVHHSLPAAAQPKLPAGIPAVKAPAKTLYTISLRYQDITTGSGEEATTGKLVRIHYTGWTAADGHKFDSSYDHPAPQKRDEKGKPLTDANGKPILGDPQPMPIPLGTGRVIPGMDQGIEGMKVGGKRRIFIPYQLAYGSKGRPSNDPNHPGIPSKADLIFDVELVSVTEMPAMPQRPMNLPHPAPQSPIKPGTVSPATATPAPAAKPAASTPAAAPVAAPAASETKPADKK